MDAIDLQLLKGKWEQLLHILADRFGEEPDLQALLFNRGSGIRAGTSEIQQR